MRGLAWLSCLITACSAGDGVYIEIKVPDGMDATTVDLYLGIRECEALSNGDPCDALSPPAIDGTRGPIEGEVFFTDDIAGFPSTVQDGSAWFYLPPTDVPAIKSTIAVGRNDNGNTGVAILQKIVLDQTLHVIGELEPVVDQHLRGQTPSVEVWAAPDTAYRCVAAAAGGRTVFVVPEDDPDCDQAAAIECAPGRHLAVEPHSSLLPDQDCLISTPNTSACILGSRPCNEAAGPSGTCIEGGTRFCVPNAACACESFDEDCVASLIESDAVGQTKTRIACFVEVELTPVNNTLRTCVDRFTQEISIADRPCEVVGITAMSKPAFGGFTTSFPIPNALNPATIVPQTVAGLLSCRFFLPASNADLSAVPPTLNTVLKIDAVPPARQRFMLLPLDVTFIQGNCADANKTRCVMIREEGEKVTECGI